MADEAARLADRWDVPPRGAPVDVDATMVDYTLRTVGRVLFGADVDDAVPVIRETFPILNRHVRRRGITPLRLPRQLAHARPSAGPPPPSGRSTASVDAIIERRSEPDSRPGPT